MIFFNSIIWKIISYIMFSICNSIIRYLIGGSSFFIVDPVPIYIIIMYSYLFGSFLIFPSFLLKKKFINFNFKNIVLHILRLFFFVSGFLLWGLSFKFMTLVQVVIISFGSYLLSIFGSFFFLKENISFKRWLALIISIFGIAFTTFNMTNLYNQEISNLAFLLPIFSSFSFSLEKLVSRKLLLLKETSESLTFYVMFFTAPFCMIPVAKYGWFYPDINHFFYFFALGFFSVLSIYAHNKAYCYSEVTFLMPFFPFKLIISCIFGFLFFGEIPNFIDIFIWIFILIFCFILLYFDN